MKVIREDEFDMALLNLDADIKVMEETFTKFNESLNTLNNCHGGQELEFLFNPLINEGANIKKIVDLNIGYLTSLKDVKKSYVEQSNQIASDLKGMASEMEGEI